MPGFFFHWYLISFQIYVYNTIVSRMLANCMPPYVALRVLIINAEYSGVRGLFSCVIIDSLLEHRSLSSIITAYTWISPRSTGLIPYSGLIHLGQFGAWYGQRSYSALILPIWHLYRILSCEVAYVAPPNSPLFPHIVLDRVVSIEQPPGKCEKLLI